QHHSQLPVHAHRYLMNGVLDFYALSFPLVHTLFEYVLRLGNGQSVAGSDNDCVGVSTLQGHSLGRGFADGLVRIGCRAAAPAVSIVAAEGSEKHVADPSSHGRAHNITVNVS